MYIHVLDILVSRVVPVVDMLMIDSLVLYGMDPSNANMFVMFTSCVNILRHKQNRKREIVHVL